MYLSRVPIDVTSYKGLQFVGSPYRVHAAIEASFSPTAKRVDESGRILWRLDEAIGRADCAWLYVLSPEKPDLTHIVEQVSVSAGDKPECKCYDKVLETISVGSRWRFRLKANPSRKVMVDKGRRQNADLLGSIQGHVTEDQQRTWLADRAASHGFGIVSASNGAEALMVSHRQRERFRRGDTTVTIATAQFDGVLEVSDADAFRHTLGFGIGRAKGFGCGLLTIAPIGRV